MVSRADIETAHHRIAPYIRETPVIALEPGALGVPTALWLKLESLQHTGSFKPRGAFNRLLTSDMPASGVIAASGGNHGIAVAYAAQQFGIPAEIFVPTISAPVKIDRIRAYGAQVTVTGEAYAEAFAASQKRAQETGALVVHAYDQPEVLAGQGTLGREWESQVEEIDTLLIAVGGGGLIGGIAAWFAGRITIIGVEPEGSSAFAAALRAGELVDVSVRSIAADSLGARRVGALMFALTRQYRVNCLLVSDVAIQEAQRRLWQELRVVAEPGGATALAALTSGVYQPAPGERVGVLICGGNTDPGTVG
jgi:threonine dehydratase